MKKKLLWFAVTLCLTMMISSSYAQMNYWGIIPNKIDFTGGSPALSTIPSAPAAPFSADAVSNAMWDENGNLLFYIVNSTIYRPNGTVAGGVSMPLTSFTSGIPATFKTLTPKFLGYHIIPVPGSVTRKYYVIHSAFISSGVALVYTTVECTTPGSVTVTVPANSRVYDSSIGNFSAIAITKPRTNNNRFLYYFCSGMDGATTKDLVKKFEITSSGIFATPGNNNIYTTTLNTTIHETVDADIYEDQDGYLLAWASPNFSKYNCIKLNTSGDYAGTAYTYTLPASHKPGGIEISADGKSIYATVSGTAPGVYKTSITGSPSIIPSSANYSETQIELAKDGLLYVVHKTTGALTTLDPITNGFAASVTGLIVPSSYRFWTPAGFIYNLPKQQDNENYACIYSQPAIPYSATINANAFTLNCASTPYTFNSCDPITFNTSHSITPAFYQFDIQSMDGSCNVNGAANTIHYNSGWVSGAPAANLNLGTFTDVNGINLNVIAAGKVRVIYSVKNTCGEVRSITTYFNTANPGVGLSNFTLNGSGAATSCASPLNLYQCTTSSLLMTPTVKNPSVSYQLTIQAVDGSCNVLTGAGLIDYTSGWISGALAANTELITRTDVNGINLGNYTGLALITYSVKDFCNVTTSVSHKVRMNTAPAGANTTLTLNSYTSPGIPLPAAASVPGVLLGIYSGSFNLNSVSLIGSYSITIDEVDCSTGAVAVNICTGIVVTPPSPTTTITSINLNSLNIPAVPARSWGGGFGYFAAKGFNTCYLISVTPSNTCGGTTLSSYIKDDCFCRMGTSTGIVAEAEGNAIYPTIFDEQVIVDYLLEGSDNHVSLKVYDLSGRLIATPVDGLVQGSGTQQLNVNTTSIVPGSYIFVLEANGSKFSQLMNKK